MESEVSNLTEMATERSRRVKRKSRSSLRGLPLLGGPSIGRDYDVSTIRRLVVAAAGLLGAADALLASTRAVVGPDDGNDRDRFFTTAKVVPPPDAALRAPGPLTIREREVAVLVGQGRTNRQIAQTLFISERTAENHVQNILNKLGCDTRVQIAAWAIKNGLTRNPLAHTPIAGIDPHEEESPS